MSRSNIKVSLPGESGKKVMKSPPPITMKQAIEHVEKTVSDELVKEGVIKKISRYPANTLHVALANLSNIIAEVKKELR